MKRLLVLVASLLPLAASASTLLAVPKGDRIVVRASAGTISALDAASLRPLWTAPGVRRPRALVLSSDGRWAAAVDSISNQIALADVSRHSSRVLAVPETPVAAAFHGGALYVLSRDAARLSRIDPTDASVRSVEAPVAASHLLAAPEGIIVYAALTGTTARFDPVTLQLLARRSLNRYASDLESEGGTGYLVEPRQARLTVFSLETLAVEEERAAGAVPVDVEVEAPANAARGARIAIADPSSKRVWRDEGAQSTAAAVGRGFLRGLLGLGLYRPGSTAFRSGVDRVAAIGGRIWAFDTSTGSLYAVRGESAKKVASGLTWGSFAPLGEDVLVARGDSIERIDLP